jgi:hypothetical protein
LSPEDDERVLAHLLLVEARRTRAIWSSIAVTLPAARRPILDACSSRYWCCLIGVRRVEGQIQVERCRRVVRLMSFTVSSRAARGTAGLTTRTLLIPVHDTVLLVVK